MNFFHYILLFKLVYTQYGIKFTLRILAISSSSTSFLSIGTFPHAIVVWSTCTIVFITTRHMYFETIVRKTLDTKNPNNTRYNHSPHHFLSSSKEKRHKDSNESWTFHIKKSRHHFQFKILRQNMWIFFLVYSLYSFILNIRPSSYLKF